MTSKNYIRMNKPFSFSRNKILSEFDILHLHALQISTMVISGNFTRSDYYFLHYSSVFKLDKPSKNVFIPLELRKTDFYAFPQFGTTSLKLTVCPAYNELRTITNSRKVTALNWANNSKKLHYSVPFDSSFSNFEDSISLWELAWFEFVTRLEYLSPSRNFDSSRVHVFTESGFWHYDQICQAFPSSRAWVWTSSHYDDYTYPIWFSVPPVQPSKWSLLLKASSTLSTISVESWLRENIPRSWANWYFHSSRFSDGFTNFIWLGFFNSLGWLTFLIYWLEEPLSDYCNDGSFDTRAFFLDYTFPLVYLLDEALYTYQYYADYRVEQIFLENPVFLIYWFEEPLYNYFDGITFLSEEFFFDYLIALFYLLDGVHRVNKIIVQENNSDFSARQKWILSLEEDNNVTEDTPQSFSAISDYVTYLTSKLLIKLQLFNYHPRLNGGILSLLKLDTLALLKSLRGGVLNHTKVCLNKTTLISNRNHFFFLQFKKYFNFNNIFRPFGVFFLLGMAIIQQKAAVILTKNPVKFVVIRALFNIKNKISIIAIFFKIYIILKKYLQSTLVYFTWLLKFRAIYFFLSWLLVRFTRLNYKLAYRWLSLFSLLLLASLFIYIFWSLSFKWFVVLISVSIADLLWKRKWGVDSDQLKPNFVVLNLLDPFTFLRLFNWVKYAELLFLNFFFFFLWVNFYFISLITTLIHWILDCFAAVEFKAWTLINFLLLTLCFKSELRVKKLVFFSPKLNLLALLFFNYWPFIYRYKPVVNVFQVISIFSVREFSWFFIEIAQTTFANVAWWKDLTINLLEWRQMFSLNSTLLRAGFLSGSRVIISPFFFFFDVIVSRFHVSHVYLALLKDFFFTTVWVNKFKKFINDTSVTSLRLNWRFYSFNVETKLSSLFALFLRVEFDFFCFRIFRILLQILYCAVNFCVTGFFFFFKFFCKHFLRFFALFFVLIFVSLCCNWIYLLPYLIWKIGFILFLCKKS